MAFFRVDPRDDESFTAWFDVLHRSELDRDQGRDEAWLPQERRARALDEAAPLYHQLFALSVASRFVAIGSLELTQDSNLEWIRGELFVDPPHRRKGFGSQMLAHLEATARSLGRSSLLFWVPEKRWEGEAAPNRSFAPIHGYEIIEENITRELAWPRPEGELDHLHAASSPKATQYEMLSWRGSAPKRLLAGLAALKSLMPVEVPDSGFGATLEPWDENLVRQHEVQTDEMGRDLLVAVALDRASGEVVAFSELTVSRDNPETAYQWDTLVLRSHRGHSLGALLKIATMRLLSSGNYQTKKIMTSNNRLNAAMIAVNESFGFIPTGGTVVWRKHLSP